MSRLDIKTASKAQTVVDRLYKDMERRIASSPPGLCPIDMSLTFLQLCHAQSCGKCVPCRIGLGQLSILMGQVLDGTGTMLTIDTIEKTARAIVASADCAIGRDAAQLVLSGFEGFRDDYVNHVQHHRCLASLQNPVPCVSLCPAGVDVPGYIALVREGRYADAVRLIRKDNPMPTACAYICEHPCEARCRRNMVDAPVNIRGLKRYAVDHAGDVPNPACGKSTGKRVAIIGGGPSGLSCAYYLRLMGHSVTIFEEKKQLGGMLRYGIPAYRFPREKLDAEITSILSTGVEAFGWEIPTYVHCSPVMRDAQHKMSKRHGDPSYEDLIREGYLTEAVLNYVALLGWSPKGENAEREFYTLAELAEIFDISGISKSPAVFDINKLRWMNAEYMKKLSPEAFFAKAEPVLKAAITNPAIDLRAVAALVQPRCEILSDLPERVDFIDKLPEYSTELYVHKKSKTTLENSLSSLQAILPVLEVLQTWTNESLYEALVALAAKLEVKNSVVLWPLRVAVSGKASTPGGATELCALLGKEESLARIRTGIELLSR